MKWNRLINPIREANLQVLTWRTTEDFLLNLPKTVFQIPRCMTVGIPVLPVFKFLIWKLRLRTVFNATQWLVHHSTPMFGNLNPYYLHTFLQWLIYLNTPLTKSMLFFWLVGTVLFVLYMLVKPVLTGYGDVHKI